MPPGRIIGSIGWANAQIADLIGAGLEHLVLAP